MPYNEQIDARIRAVVSHWTNTDAKKMFGGVCHLRNGNMVCGVYKDYLILRLGQKRVAEALQQAFVKPFDITGLPMKGWVMVENHGIDRDDQLEAWLNQAKVFVDTLPPK
jgi:hypothetical protein